MILGRLSTQPLTCTLLFTPPAVQIGLVRDEGGVAVVYLLKVRAADEVRVSVHI